MQKLLNIKLEQLPFLLILCGLSSCITYEKAIRNTYKNAFGSQFSEYEIMTYPTDNFGVGTIWNGGVNSPAECIMLQPCFVPQFTDSEWLRLKGNAQVGEGASIDFSDTKNMKVGANAVLPTIAKVLNLQGSLDSDNTQVTKFTFGKGYYRSLTAFQLRTLINNLRSKDPNNDLVLAFDQKQLTITYSDVVLEDMTLNVKVNNTVSAQLDAKVSAPTLLGADSKVDDTIKGGINIKRVNEGEYNLVSKRPIIVMRWYKKQNAGQGNAADTLAQYNPETWQTIKKAQ